MSAPRIRHRSALSNDVAQLIIESAKEAALKAGVPSAIAVVDESGHLNAFVRMDGAALLTIEIAQDKAYTAAGFGMPTDQWHEFVRKDAPLAVAAPAGVRNLNVFGGGLPITLDGETIGGIGVSGGHWSDNLVVAKAGLAVIESL